MGSVSVIVFSFAALGVRASPLNYMPIDVDTSSIAIAPTSLLVCNQAPSSSAVETPVTSTFISLLSLSSDSPTYIIASGTSVTPTPDSSLVSSLLPSSFITSRTFDPLSIPIASLFDISSPVSLLFEATSAVDSPAATSAELAGVPMQQSGPGGSGNAAERSYLNVGPTEVLKWWGPRGRDVTSTFGSVMGATYTGTVAAELATTDSQYYPQTTDPHGTTSFEELPQSTSL